MFQFLKSAPKRHYPNIERFGGMDGWIDGLMDGSMDGWVDGWVEAIAILFPRWRRTNAAAAAAAAAVASAACRDPNG